MQRLCATLHVAGLLLLNSVPEQKSPNGQQDEARAVYYTRHCQDTTDRGTISAPAQRRAAGKLVPPAASRLAAPLVRAYRQGAPMIHALTPQAERPERQWLGLQRNCAMTGLLGTCDEYGRRLGLPAVNDPPSQRSCHRYPALV